MATEMEEGGQAGGREGRDNAAISFGRSTGTCSVQKHCWLLRHSATVAVSASYDDACVAHRRKIGDAAMQANVVYRYSIGDADKSRVAAIYAGVGGPWGSGFFS